MHTGVFDRFKFDPSSFQLTHFHMLVFVFVCRRVRVWLIIHLRCGSRPFFSAERIDSHRLASGLLTESSELRDSKDSSRAYKLLVFFHLLRYMTSLRHNSWASIRWIRWVRSEKCYQEADWSDSRWRGKPKPWGRVVTLIVKCSHLGCGQVDQASASLTHCLPENSWPKWHHVIDLMFGTHHVISPEISVHVEMSLAFSLPNLSRGYYPMLLHYLSLKFWNKPGVSFEIKLESFIHVWISDRIRKTWECRVKNKNLIPT